MNNRPLGFDFSLMSPLSRHHPRVKLGEAHFLMAEDELLDRRRLYPRLIEQQRMKADEAERHLRVWTAIVEDIRPEPARYFGGDVDWEDKVRELRRELSIRRNTYPNQIARRQRTEDTARRNCELLDQVHFCCWMGTDCGTRFGDAAAWRGLDRTAATRAARQFYLDRHAFLLAAHAAGDRALDNFSDEDRRWSLKIVAEYAGMGMHPTTDATLVTQDQVAAE